MPIDLGGRHSLNIFRVTYRSAINGRRIDRYIKVPDGGLPLVTDLLARAEAKGQIHYFKVAIAKPHEISEHRSELARGIDALRASSVVSRVDWAL